MNLQFIWRKNCGCKKYKSIRKSDDIFRAAKATLHENLMETELYTRIPWSDVVNDIYRSILPFRVLHTFSRRAKQLYSQATQANCWYVRHMPALSSSVPSELSPGPNATLMRKGVVQASTRQLPSASSSFWLHSELPQCSKLQIPAMLLPGCNRQSFHRSDKTWSFSMTW